MTLSEAVKKAGRFSSVEAFCKRWGVPKRTMYDWWESRRSVVEGLLEAE